MQHTMMKMHISNASPIRCHRRPASAASIVLSEVTNTSSMFLLLTCHRLLMPFEPQLRG
jgi:hypothetical protein